jgi:hypothetical protein
MQPIKNYFRPTFKLKTKSMKASLLTILIFFSCLSVVSAQKKYMVKVTTLDNKVYKGLMFQVRDKDFLILLNSVHWDFKVKENNIPQTKSFDFRIVKDIKIRRKGRIGKGILVGYVTGLMVGVAIAKSSNKQYNSTNDGLGISRVLNAFGIVIVSTTAGPVLGGVVGGSYPHQFEVKKDSTSIQSLKTKLKKYEWYHAEEGMAK